MSQGRTENEINREINTLRSNFLNFFTPIGGLVIYSLCSAQLLTKLRLFVCAGSGNDGLSSFRFGKLYQTLADS